MSLEIVSIIVTISLAFFGYLISYWSNLLLTRREKKLEHINKQLEEFHGPLFVATQKSDKAYAAFKQKLNRKTFFSDTNNLPTDEEIQEWRIWAKNVLMPNNQIIEKLIHEKSYLIQDEQLPACLLDFITHLSGFKAVIAKWEDGDFTENVSFVFYPSELPLYAKESFQNLKNEQLKLLGKRKK